MKKGFVMIFAALLITVGALNANALPTAEYGVDANTVALYHFSQTSQATDATGDHNGTLQGDAAIVAGGKFGAGALSLDGWGDYVDIGQSGAWNMAAGTVEMWVNLASPLSNGRHGTSWVLSNTGTGYGNYWDDGWFLGVHSDISPNLLFMSWNYGWNVADSGVNPDTLVGGWHHVAGTWGPRGLEIWIDGVLKGTNPWMTAGTAGTAKGLIGTDAWTWDTHGMINEARISDIQRTFSPNSVPEPCAMLLLGLGLVGAAAVRKRCR